MRVSLGKNISRGFLWFTDRPSRAPHGASPEGYTERLLGLSLVMAFAAACRGPSDDSSAKIVGGAVETQRPEVVRIPLSRNPPSICTGIKMSDTTILVAAHCIDAQSIVDGLAPEGQVVKSKKVVSYQTLEAVSRFDVASGAFDLAAIVYPPGTVTGPYAKMAAAPVPQGEAVTLVGYGATSFSQPASDVVTGDLRSGTNKVAEARDSVYLIQSALAGPDSIGSDTQQAIAAPGDSGGALFNQAGELVGLLVGLSFQANGQTLPLSYNEEGHIQLPLSQANQATNLAVNLLSDTSSRLLAAAAAGRQDALDQSVVPNPTVDEHFLAICSGSKRRRGRCDRMFRGPDGTCFDSEFLARGGFGGAGGAFPGGAFPGGSFPGGSFPGGSFPGGALPGGTIPGVGGGVGGVPGSTGNPVADIFSMF